MGNKINGPMQESDDLAFCWLIENPMTEEGYKDGFIPGVEHILKTRNEMRLLVFFKNYKGWDENAVPYDLYVMGKFYKHPGRIALVNPPEKIMLRKENMTDLIGSDVRIFPTESLGKALEWVKA